MKVYFAISSTVLLCACATPPTDGSGRILAIADAGEPPANPMAVVQEALRYRLKDFDSARIDLNLKPRPVVFAKAAGLNEGGAGWEICPNVNAKNSFGAYTGYKRIFILWSRGKVIDFNASDMAEFWCRDSNDARIAVGERVK